MRMLVLAMAGLSVSVAIILLANCAISVFTLQVKRAFCWKRKRREDLAARAAEFNHGLHGGKGGRGLQFR